MSDIPQVDSEIKVNEDIFKRINTVQGLYNEKYDQLADQIEVQIEDYVNKGKNEDDQRQRDSEILTALGLYSDTKEESERILNSNPEIRQIVEPHQVLIDELKQVQSDLQVLYKQAIDEALPDIQTQASYLRTHLRIDMISDLDTDPNVARNILNIYQEVSEEGLNIDLDPTIPKSVAVEMQYRRIIYKKEQLDKLNPSLNSEILSDTPIETTRPSTEEVEETKKLLSNVDTYAKGMEEINREIKSYTITSKQRSFTYPLVESLNAYYKSDEGIPITIADNETLMVLCANRIQKELEAEDYFTYFPMNSEPPSEVNIEKAYQEILDHAEKLAKWITLSNKFKANVTSRFTIEVPFSLLGYEYNNNPGQLPIYIQENPHIAIVFANKIAVLQDTYKKLGMYSNEGDMTYVDRIDKVPFETPIIGLEPKAGLELVLTGDELKNKINVLLPTYFTQGLSSIEIVENSHFVPEEESTALYPLMKDFYQNRIISDILHETFEHTVTLLSIDEMENYQKAIEADRNIGKSEYVTRYARKSALLVSAELGNKEDFCDAGAMFLQKPTDLFLIAPERYKYFVNLIASHMPEKEAVIYKEDQDNFITDLESRIPQQKVDVGQDKAGKVVVQSKEEFDLRQHEIMSDVLYQQVASTVETWHTVAEYIAEDFIEGKPSGKIKTYLSPYVKLT